MTELSHIVLIDRPLCRRCVRALSRRLRDVPGVRSFAVDVAGGRITVTGDADPWAVRAAVGTARCAQGEAGAS